VWRLVHCRVGTRYRRCGRQVCDMEQTVDIQVSIRGGAILLGLFLYVSL
jgi:hypothetical protein